MSADISNPSHLRYELVLQRHGYGHCNCLDFISRGGACKHLRLLRIYIDKWILEGLEKPFYYPLTPEASVSSTCTSTKSNFQVLDDTLVRNAMSASTSEALDCVDLAASQLASCSIDAKHLFSLSVTH